MPRLQVLFVAALLFLCSVCQTTAQTPAAPDLAPEVRALIERLDSQASQELAREKLGSITVGVVSGSRLVWSRSHGLADMDRQSSPATRPRSSSTGARRRA